MGDEKPTTYVTLSNTRAHVGLSLSAVSATTKIFIHTYKDFHSQDSTIPL